MTCHYAAVQCKGETCLRQESGTLSLVDNQSTRAALLCQNEHRHRHHAVSRVWTMLGVCFVIMIMVDGMTSPARHCMNTKPQSLL